MTTPEETAKITKYRLHESERLIAKWLKAMKAKRNEIAEAFGCSPGQIGDSLRGQEASSGYKDITGDHPRYEIPGEKCDAVLRLADNLLARYPDKRPVYDKIFAFLLSEPLPAELESAVESEPVVEQPTLQLEQATNGEVIPLPDEMTEEPKIISNLANLLDRIGDSYIALGEQLGELFQRISQGIGQGVDEDQVNKLVDVAVQRAFAKLAGG